LVGWQAKTRQQNDTIKRDGKSAPHFIQFKRKQIYLQANKQLAQKGR